MCSILEPYGTIAVASEMRSAGGPLVAVGPSPETILASVSASSVALLRLDDSRTMRYWFGKPSTPFTTTAVWDSVGNKIVSASQGKILAWPNTEKAEPNLVVDCPSPVLSLLPHTSGLIVVCKNGLAFRLKYDNTNWEIQKPSVAKSATFSSASLLGDDILMLADDGKSVVRVPLTDLSSKTIIKLAPKFIVAASCLHDNQLYVGNSQGKLLVLQDGSFELTKIDLKMDKNQLTGLMSCGKNLLIASQTMLSIWDVQFGLAKATSKIPFDPWANKCFEINSKAFFAHTTLMVVPLKVAKWSLASLVGSRKKSEKKTPSCHDTCESLLAEIANWTSADIMKHIHEIDDLSEQLVIRCWRRLLEIHGETSVVLKLLAARHDCVRFTAVLHESLTAEEVQQSLDLLSSAMDSLTLAQLTQGRLECLLDWACHFVDAHKNALRFGLKSNESDSMKKSVETLDRSLRRVQEFTEKLQDRQYELKVFLNKAEEIRIPRERLYWIEPWALLNKT